MTFLTTGKKKKHTALDSFFFFFLKGDHFLLKCREHDSIKRCRREKLNKTELTCREPQRCPEVQLVLLLEKYGLNYMPSAASDEQTPRPARLEGMPLMLTI